MKNPQFNQQVNWELACLEKADLVIMYFGPDSKSPISLLELGLFKDKIVCYCPEEFYRKGNVDIVGAKYGFPIFENIVSFYLEINKRLRQEI